MNNRNLTALFIAQQHRQTVSCHDRTNNPGFVTITTISLRRAFDIGRIGYINAMNLIEPNGWASKI
jgi:hypothetical protein